MPMSRRSGSVAGDDLGGSSTSVSTLGDPLPRGMVPVEIEAPPSHAASTGPQSVNGLNGSPRGPPSGGAEEGKERSAQPSGGRLEWFAIQSVCTVSIFAALLGYDIGVMSGAVLPMVRDLGFTDQQTEVAVGCLNFVSALGAITGGSLYNRLGAVSCVRVAVALYALGMLMIAASYDFWQVLSGRVVCGLGVGLGFAICPQYIAEISPPAWRGFLVSMFEISINVGLCAGYAANLALESLQDSPRWRGCMLVPLPPTALVLLVMVPKLPESPRWLMREPGREAVALEVLIKTCGETAAPSALADIQGVIATQDDCGGDSKGHGSSGWSALFFEPVARRALLIGAGTAFFQQGNGSEAAVYYVPQVLRAAGVTSEHAQLQAASLVGFCKTVCIVVGQLSVDKYGRRIMLLSSIAAVTGSLCMLAWCLGGGAGPNAAGVTLTALCLFMASFSLGMGPVTWVVASEIFPLRVRARGTAFSMAVNRLTSGTVAMTFLSLAGWLGAGGAFVFFACVSALHFAFTFVMLPETKGKTLEEIEALLGMERPRAYQRLSEDQRGEQNT